MLTHLDLDNIIHLQKIVVEGLTESSAYYPLTIDEVAMLLGKRGISLGAYNTEEELIGYAAAYFPGNASDNLGLDLALSGNELLQVAHIETGLVHPSFRGRGWQKSLYQELLRGIAKQDKYRYILSTVACNNYPALRNSLKLKLSISGLREKYGNKLRYLVSRDLEETLRFCPDTIIRCQSTDIVSQQSLIGQGYYGFDVEYETNSLVVCYGLKVDV
jgi:ribosomal protein S18 acetylase RimI-like enzyme